MSASSPSSETIIDNVNSLLDTINNNETLLVFGYITNKAANFIPNAIINYILLYAYLKVEHFEFVDENINCSIDRKTLSNSSQVDYTSYGSSIIDCRMQTKCIYKWKIKINNTESLIAIGLNESESLTLMTTFYYDHSTHYACDNYGYMYDDTTIGRDSYSAFDTGDTVILSLNAQTRKLTFYKEKQNTKAFYKANFSVKPSQYRLAVFLSGNFNFGEENDCITSVTLQEFIVAKT